MATAPCVPYPTATDTDAVRSSLILPGDGPPGRSSPRQTADTQQRHRIRCQPRRCHDSLTLHAGRGVSVCSRMGACPAQRGDRESERPENLPRGARCPRGVTPPAGAPRSTRRRATAGRQSAGGPGWRSCASGTCRCRECHPLPATSTLTPGPERDEHPAMTLSFLYLAFCRTLQLIGLVGRSDTDLAVEIVMLRHEVAVRRRQVHRAALKPADRAMLAGLSRLLPRRRLGGFFVQPTTLLGWHRDLVAKRWTYAHGNPGRPSHGEGTTALVLRLAKENPTWGYRRIHGELATMGIAIAPSSVWAILKRHGIEPSPRRSGPTWAELLAAQAKGLMACDLRSRHHSPPQALRPRPHPPRQPPRADRRHHVEPGHQLGHPASPQHLDRTRRPDEPRQVPQPRPRHQVHRLLRRRPRRLSRASQRAPATPIHQPTTAR